MELAFVVVGLTVYCGVVNLLINRSTNSRLRDRWTGPWP